MTLEGGNLNISNSIINITYINRVTIYKSMEKCDLYYNSGSSNNQIWNNNTFVGFS